jgi:2-oxoglutarate dehydrogenase dihydrolipoamide succinyltransferase (E2 component)
MSSSRTDTSPAEPDAGAHEEGPRRSRGQDDQAGAEDSAAAVVLMPQMGVSVAEGTILEWRKAVGDEVAADETIADVTTDKVDVEIPCPASGVLTKIMVEPGETVAVGTPIAEIGGESTEPSTEQAEPAAGASEPAPATAEPAPGNGSAPDRSRFYSPVVRRIADEHDIDLSSVEGTGIGGRVRKRDLLAVIESGVAKPAEPERPMHTESPYVPDEPPAQAAPAAGDGGHREPMSTMRQAIARHMVESRRTAAHCTTIVEVDMHRVAATRAELKEAMARRGVPLTYLAFVARATVDALGEFPVLNASVEGSELVYHDNVNLGIAVALDEGLIVPVIPKAQRLSLEGIAAAIADVAERARSKKLEPDEVHGGTFTITNPGQFGAVLATPIINQPQVAILDLEAIVKRPVVLEGDAIAVRPMTYLPMSWDHRALDGATAAKFLGRVKARLEGWEAG